VSPNATANEIRRSYLHKINESHPDRVAWLAPELVAAAEKRSKILNVAYAEAMRARRGSSEPKK
jgi:DnaJ-domain-containing protein 1